jgi:CubicO group peptidase (beta-lactamase class C family)
MRRLSIILGFTVSALVAWAAIVAADARLGWTRAPLAPRGDARAFFEAAAARIDAENHGNAIFALIEDGRVVGVHAQSKGEPVSVDTLFQVASLSKWVTAWGVLRLVDEGVLDLDAPVSTYLTRWRLPDGPYDDAVTIRRILSHTAGFTDGLGYLGFPPGTPVQSLEDSLTRATDALPGADGAVRVGVRPGERWIYSGGGYTLLQLVIEEVTGESFAGYMKRAVLTPLGMTSSTYELGPEDSARVATFYDAEGQPATHYRFTATAAASLYTSGADLTRFLQAQSATAESPGAPVLRRETVAAVARPEATIYGLPLWGLGAILYAPNDDGGFVLGHDGSNVPAINTTARIDPASGDAIIVLLTGAETLATRIGGEWTFWKTDRIDLLTLRLAQRQVLWRIVFGWIVILALAAAYTRSSTRPA